MARVMRRQQRQQEPPADPQRDGSLPLRWAFIIMASLGAALAVVAIASVVPGVTIGLGVAGLLHKVLPKS